MISLSIFPYYLFAKFKLWLWLYPQSLCASFIVTKLIMVQDSEIEEDTSTSLAMTVSNHSSGNFSREMTFLKEAFLPSGTGRNILQDCDLQVIMLKLCYLTSKSFRYPGISFLIFYFTSNSFLQGLFVIVKEQNMEVNNAALTLRLLRLLLYQFYFNL